jgi:hypothetical protein
LDSIGSDKNRFLFNLRIDLPSAVSFRNGKLIAYGSYIAMLPGVHPRVIRAVEENAKDGLSDVGTLQHDLLYFANVALGKRLISQDNGGIVHAVSASREAAPNNMRVMRPNEKKMSDDGRKRALLGVKV